MNLLKKFTLLILIVLSTSCNFTENITINEDGTGDFVLEIDANSLMAIAGDNFGEKMKQSENFKIIDSTFSFNEIYEEKKDSFAKLPAEEQEVLRKMKDFVVYIKINSEKQEMLFSVSSPFKNVSDVQSMISGMKKLNDLQGKSGKKQLPSSLGDRLNNNANFDFTYNKASFTRTAMIGKKDLNDIAEDSTGMSNMIFASSKYILKYHFPKPVKKVSNPDAMYSADRKTITIQYPFTFYMENPEKTNLTIDFE